MIVALIAGGVVVAWLMVGGVAAGASGIPRGPNCAACTGLDGWWASLGFWKKIGMGAWYGARKVGCAINGCPTG